MMRKIMAFLLIVMLVLSSFLLFISGNKIVEHNHRFEVQPTNIRIFQEASER
jgi:hypothetical protein